MPTHAKRESKRELTLGRSNEQSHETSPNRALSENLGRSSAADPPRRKTTKGDNKVTGKPG
jgi:hypothetical protein